MPETRGAAVRKLSTAHTIFASVGLKKNLKLLDNKYDDCDYTLSSEGLLCALGGHAHYVFFVFVVCRRLATNVGKQGCGAIPPPTGLEFVHDSLIPNNNTNKKK